MNPLAEKLKKNLKKSKDYRHGYVDEFLNTFIATQVKVLREQRGWSQEKLANEAGMKQARISVLENVNYSSWSINTLRRIAEAFDLTLNVSFEEFGKRLRDIERFSRESLERFSFKEDPVFQAPQAYALVASSKELRGQQVPNVISLEAYKSQGQAEKVGQGVSDISGERFTAISRELSVIGVQ